MLVEIRNWEKYNPRSDVKSTHWLRLQNDILIELFDLTSDQKLTWIALLCEASRKQTGRIDISPGLIAALLKTSEETVLRALDAFVEKGFISKPVHERDADVTQTSRERNAHELPRAATGRDGTGRNVENYVSEPDGSRPPEPDTSQHPPGPRDLAALWNARKAAGQPRLNPTTFRPGGKRWGWAQKRLLEHPDLAYWGEVIDRVAKSDFCNGANERAWKADFEFLVRAETHVKVAEGKYDNRAGPKGAVAGHKQPIVESREELRRERHGN